MQDQHAKFQRFAKSLAGIEYMLALVTALAGIYSIWANDHVYALVFFLTAAFLSVSPTIDRIIWRWFRSNFMTERRLPKAPQQKESEQGENE